MNTRTLLPLLALLPVAGFALSCHQAPVATATPITRPIAAIIQPNSGEEHPYRAAIEKGVQFLVKSQQPDGSWGTGLETRGLEITSMVPGSHDAFRVGTTALCVMALREAGEKTAHDKGLEYLLSPAAEARRDDGMLLYNTWAHIYGLEALAIEMRTNPDPRIKERAQWNLDRLVRYSSYTGGWNYYDFKNQTQSPSMGGTSFGTAAGLVALWEARQSGLDVPQKMIDLAIKRVEDCRLPNGVYLYGFDYRYAPRLDANQAKGAVGRTQPSNYALWLWSSPKVAEAQATQGLELFYEHHIYLDMGRKRPWPHESWYQTSGYYYYYDHYYAAKLIERLSPGRRADDGRKLATYVIPHQEEDGSWWDYAMWDYHKPYGTAFAVMTLLRCEKMQDDSSSPTTAPISPGVTHAGPRDSAEVRPKGESAPTISRSHPVDR